MKSTYVYLQILNVALGVLCALIMMAIAYYYIIYNMSSWALGIILIIAIVLLYKTTRFTVQVKRDLKINQCNQ